MVVVSFQRNITGNSPIFLPAITRKADAKVLLFTDTRCWKTGI